MRTTHIFSKDIGMEFGIEKCPNVGDRKRKDCEIS